LLKNSNGKYKQVKEEQERKSLQGTQLETEVDTKRAEKKMSSATAKFGEPYEDTRKYSKFDVVGQDFR
jgi:hypothetical protein